MYDIQQYNTLLCTVYCRACLACTYYAANIRHMHIYAFRISLEDSKSGWLSGLLYDRALALECSSVNYCVPVQYLRIPYTCIRRIPNPESRVSKSHELNHVGVLAQLE